MCTAGALSFAETLQSRLEMWCLAGDTSDESRRRLVTDHEDVHIWQSRIMGPIFPIVYLGWMAIMAPVAAAGWLRRRIAGDRSSSLWAAVDRRFLTGNTRSNSRRISERVEPAKHDLVERLKELPAAPNARCLR